VRFFIEARLADRLLCVSRQPFLDSARVLLGEAHDPSTALVMRHAGTESLRSTIGYAAKLTVKEPEKAAPYFGKWTPYPSPVAPPIDFESEGVPEVPDAPEIASVEESPGNPPLHSHVCSAPVRGPQ